MFLLFRPAHKVYAARSVPSAGPQMTEVVFLSSTQGYQMARVQEMADRLRADHPELKIEILDSDRSGPVLAQHKLKFGPAVLVDGRIEFVGIPRYRMLVARVTGPRVTDRTAGDKAVAKAAVPPAPSGAAAPQASGSGPSG